MPNDYRILISQKRLAADANILIGHPGEQAAWIWIQEPARPITRFLRFEKSFTVTANAGDLILHITADQRYQLYCDDQPVSFGPDRCDLNHWAVTTCRLSLSPGPHRLTAFVWWIAPQYANLQLVNPPMAQVTWQGGFLLAAEGVFHKQLSTGFADWHVTDLTAAVSLARKSMHTYHDIGPSYTVDLARWQQGAPAQTVIVLPPLAATDTGVRQPGWVLTAATLPEQQRREWTGGKIRACWRQDFGERPLTTQDLATDSLLDWHGLLTDGQPVIIPSHSQVAVLWDCESYQTGYPALRWSGGAGGQIEIEWAESLFTTAPSANPAHSPAKNNRSELCGKTWFGFGDTFIAAGAEQESTPPLWWRTGRYLRLRITTTNAPLHLTRLAILQTGYPLTAIGQWESSDPSWDRLLPLLERSLTANAHENWCDCPYYEQMMYVADTALHALSNYAWFDDDRLSKRALEMFDWSRDVTGLVAERYPSGYRQESTTFALLWVSMVRDYLYWRDDSDFVRHRLPGVRSLLEQVLALLGPDNRLHEVPGWPFVDWVPEWENGCGPGVRTGDSSIVNLHLVLALQSAAQIEEAIGDIILADRWRRIGRRVFDVVMARYWDGVRGCLRDTIGNAPLSEHAQVLALRTGWLNTTQTESCRQVLLTNPQLLRCTIYFSFYLLDELYRMGAVAAFSKKLNFWRELPARGFITTPEAPDPGRSDCHAWGAHPLWHMVASIAGIRPAAPGFARVRIAPAPGTFTSFRIRIRHPRGIIELALRRNAGRVQLTVNTPPGVPTQVEWGAQAHQSGGGSVELDWPDLQI